MVPHLKTALMSQEFSVQYTLDDNNNNNLARNHKNVNHTNDACSKVDLEVEKRHKPHQFK